MARFSLENLQSDFPIIDPATGKATPYFLRLLFGNTGVTEDQEELIDLLNEQVQLLAAQKADKATLINPGFGLSGGGDLSEDRTISLGNPALVDPNADRILFWDDSAGELRWLTVGTNLAITGDTIDASGGGGGGGGFYPINNPPASTFPNSFLGPGVGISLTDTDYGVYAQRTDAGVVSAERVGVRGTPVPGPTWTAVMGIRLTPFARASQFIRQGIGCTNGTGVVSSLFSTQSGAPFLTTIYNANLSIFTNSAGGGNVFSTDILFFRLRCDGTNIIGDFSIDGGRTWVFSASRTIASTFTPTHVGIYHNSFGTITPEFSGMGVFYWSLT